MNALKAKSLRVNALMTFGCVLFLSVAWASPHRQTSQTPASEIVLTIDPTQSKVHWTVDSTLHTVHGVFALKSGTLRFDPVTGRAGGEIVVYANSGESGNASRDARMHEEILETTKYSDVVFRPTQFDSKVALSGQSEGKLRGVFSIHGTDHELVASVHADLSGDHWAGTTKFEVPYVNWGIKDPSKFLLKVKPVVSVEVDLSGAVQPPK